MVDETDEDPTPCQPPTLTELEAAWAGVQVAALVALDWLMASEEAPDVEVLLADLVNRPTWHRQAAFRRADPELFFTEQGIGRPVQALACCEDCLVRSQCLASALEVASTTGVWGGKSGLERRGLRRGAT